MDTTPIDDHKQGQKILKNNLWKFFKALRAQANSIYSLLVGSPIEYACISILDNTDTIPLIKVTPNQFVNSFREMPSKNKYYKLEITLCYLTQETQSICTYSASSRNDLSIETIKLLYPRMVAYHCIESFKHGSYFSLTPQIIKHFRIKKRYIDELQGIIDQCNNQIINL